MSRWPKPEIPHTDAPRGTCRWCGKVILKRDGTQDTRRRWHKPCLEGYQFHIYPSVATWKVRKRDRETCQACGLDTRRLSWQAFQLSGSYDEWRSMLLECGLECGRSFWEADHVVPLSQGGEHSMENLWALCVPCHRAKTSREAGIRSGRYDPPPGDPGRAKEWWKEYLDGQRREQTRADHGRDLSPAAGDPGRSA